MPKPHLGRGELVWLEANKMIPAGNAPSNEPRSLKYRNVLRHRIQGETVLPSELCHAGFGRRRKLM